MERSILNRWFLGLLMFVSIIAAQSCKQKNRDGEILTAFNAKTKTDPNLAGVTATVVDRTVTISGTCADEVCRSNAEKAVKEIDGVKKVVNNIQIAYVQVADDASLQTSAAQIAKKYGGIQTNVSGGVITVRGSIEREKLQQLMPELQALRPRRVENQLQIKND